MNTKIRPNASYKFLKATDFQNGIAFEAGREFRTDVQGQGHRMITIPGVGGTSYLGRTIPMYVLQSWLEDGRIVFSGWLPNEGDIVFYISRDMTIKSKEMGQTLELAYEAGNVFENEADAIRILTRVKAVLS